jgi:hypothetical protein
LDRVSSICLGLHIDDLAILHYTAVKNKKICGAFNVAIEDNTTNTIFSKRLRSMDIRYFC